MKKMKTKTLAEVIKERGIISQQDLVKFLQGKTVEVTSTSGRAASGHGYGKPGTKISIAKGTQISVSGWGGPTCLIGNIKPGIPAHNIYTHELKVSGGTTVKDFEGELEELALREQELKDQRENVKDVINFMQENEVGEFDEKVFNVFKALKKSKSSKNLIDQAKAIAEMV